MMKQKIAYISLVVDDYDKAIDLYTKKLHFNLIEDTMLSDTKTLGFGGSERCKRKVVLF